MHDRGVPASALLALLAFSGNSLLCRAALAGGLADAAPFTAARLVSGALLLGLVSRGRRDSDAASGPGAAAPALAPGAALAVYAIAFSFAYLRLVAAAGALVLFGATQVTMIGWGLWQGERPRTQEWLGFALAFLGLLALTVPGRSAPDLGGVLLMAVAGVAWGTYSLLGRRAGDPILANAAAFRVAAVAGLALLALPNLPRGHSPAGLGLAVVSGAIASGLGYCLWYQALPQLTRARAAILQLAVPALTAGLGVLLLGEPVTATLLGCGALILGGVALAATARSG